MMTVTAVAMMTVIDVAADDTDLTVAVLAEDPDQGLLEIVEDHDPRAPTTETDTGPHAARVQAGMIAIGVVVGVLTIHGVVHTAGLPADLHHPITRSAAIHPSIPGHEVDHRSGMDGTQPSTRTLT